MIDFLFIYWVEIVIIWAIVIPMTRHLVSRRRSATDIASLVHMVTVSLGALAQSPSLRPRIDALTGVDGLGRWMAFSLILYSVAAFWTVVSYLTHRPGGPSPRPRVRAFWVLCATSTMGVLLIGSGTRDDVGASFLAVYGGNPLVVGCYTVFIGYIAIVLVATLRAAGRYRKYTRRRYLRVGMELLLAGGVFGMAYCLYLGATVVTSYLHLPLPLGATTYAATYLGFGTVVLFLAGPTISVWGPRLTAPLRAVAQRRALRRLHPLWLALTDAMPYLRSQASHTLGNAAGYRLYRRVIEIHDGLLILEPYRDPGLDQGSLSDTVARARSISRALRAFSAGESGADAEDGHLKPERASGRVNAPTMTLMKDEVAYLTRLSRAYARLGDEA
ncbi:MAB_1171c family putative transporter [Streptosporangium sp. NPDC020145]|uniref:MAB_1171c family putative transporter n=1 Tax=Streptosporangium sp. NPDC020145 TaxID=3154694 RepID=UPI00343B1E35